MSDYVAALTALRNALISGFTALPIVWPNEPTDPTLDIASSGFVYVENRLSDERAVSLGTAGTRTHRDYGELLIWVCVPHGSRVGVAEGYAQTIRSIFGTTAVAGVVVTGRVIGQGQHWDSPAGRVWAIPVAVSYWTDRLE